MSIRKRLSRSAAVAVALAVPMFPGAASAAAPETSGLVYRVQDVFLIAFQDLPDRLVVVTGPPAELACQGLGWEPFGIDIQGIDKPNGATSFLMDGDLPVWVYRVDSIDALCDAALSGGTLELLASGPASFTFNDNDFFLGGTGMDSYGARAVGTLTTIDGGLANFRAVLRGQVEPTDSGECVCRVLVEDILLTPRG